MKPLDDTKMKQYGMLDGMEAFCNVTKNDEYSPHSLDRIFIDRYPIRF